MTKISRLLFKYRALIAVPFFVVLVLRSRPVYSLLVPVILTLVGMGIRAWAAGYLGKTGRGRDFQSEFRITSGPFKHLRHPLYIGNFFLVGGAIFLFNPKPWLAASLIGIFLVEYGIIIAGEERYLRDLPKKEEKFTLLRLRHELSTVVVVAVIWAVYYLKILLFY
jgi:protein-S-isoprenylcysteine O-methyltransferase Ste14